jgi:sugar phosphate isomerase/epimerase
MVATHAKDLLSEPGSGHVAAGRGALNYGLYLSLLRNAGFDGPLILHNLVEEEAPAAVAFLQKEIKRASDL